MKFSTDRMITSSLPEEQKMKWTWEDKETYWKCVSKNFVSYRFWCRLSAAVVKLQCQHERMNYKLLNERSGINHSTSDYSDMKRKKKSITITSHLDLSTPAHKWWWNKDIPPINKLQFHSSKPRLSPHKKKPVI